MPLFPSDTVFQQLRSRDVGGDKLEMLGKQASREWARGEHRDLSDAVVSVVKEAQLSPEQVKRVIEFTNTNAFLDEFRKEGSSHRYIDFGPDIIAHPNRVFQDLNDGSGGTVFDNGTGDYMQPVPSSLRKTGSASMLDHALSEKDEEMWKEAFATTPTSEEYVNPFFELYVLKEKIASDYDIVNEKSRGLDSLRVDTSLDLVEHVKQACREGHSLGEISEIWSKYADDTLVKLAFGEVLPKLYDSNIFTSVDAAIDSLCKTAGRNDINSEHPLVTSFADFCNIVEDTVKVANMKNDIGVQFSSVSALLAKVAEDAASKPPGMFDKGVIPGLYNGYKDILKTVSDKGSEIGETVLGPDRGKYVGKAINVAGAVGPVLLADNLMKNLAPYRWARSKVMAALPGASRPHEEEEYAHGYKVGHATNALDQFLMDKSAEEGKPSGVTGFLKSQVPYFSQGMGSAGATVAALAGVAGAKKIYDSLRKGHDFKKMLKVNPDLVEASNASPTQFKQMYDSLRYTNKHYARDPIIAGGYMRQMAASPEAAWSILTGNTSPVAARDKFKSEAGDAVIRAFQSGHSESLKNKMQLNRDRISQGVQRNIAELNRSQQAQTAAASRKQQGDLASAERNLRAQLWKGDREDRNNAAFRKELENEYDRNQRSDDAASAFRNKLEEMIFKSDLDDTRRNNPFDVPVRPSGHVRQKSSINFTPGKK